MSGVPDMMNIKFIHPNEPLTKAIQELHAEIDKLRKEIKHLRKEVKAAKYAAAGLPPLGTL